MVTAATPMDNLSFDLADPSTSRGRARPCHRAIQLRARNGSCTPRHRLQREVTVNGLLVLAIVLVALWILAQALGWVVGAVLHLFWIVALVLLAIWLFKKMRTQA